MCSAWTVSDDAPLAQHLSARSELATARLHAALGTLGRGDLENGQALLKAALEAKPDLALALRLLDDMEGDRE